MQALQIQNEKRLDSYPYEFSVFEERGLPRTIVIAIRRLDDHEFGQDDDSSIQSIFGDLGKWEAVLGVTITVLTELGLTGHKASGNVPEYLGDKFEFEKEKNTGRD